ncbi:hypothetical protein V496_06817 [Pseudogymnoascus sp. VKM F-4515 (FW-2607)]|nr:hypothetical protein V496_06817 [Pseudogymnoascus sp. VKM F-4515 (FW-2607)]
MTEIAELPAPVVEVTTELTSDSIATTARGSEVHSPSSNRTTSTPASELSSIEALKGFKAANLGVSKENARAKAATLSLVEQVSLLRAADHWRTVAIPNKGIPNIKTSDGPNGARGAVFKAGTRAALFPCGVSLAATWDTKLLYEVGQHLGEETKARSAHVLLAPTVCLHRGPLGGRNFESFSEDPLLTGKLAASYINGLQQKGIAATIKHFVANEQETERLTMDSELSERALRELYLRPFEIAVRESNPWAVMSSYNLINGVHADMNTHTLKDILRGEWKYDGLVMSDWTGVNSVAESIEAGCDLEMPYSDNWRGEKAVQAVKDGKLSQDAVEKAAANVLYLIDRVRGQDTSPEEPEREEDTPETRELIRRAGSQGLTLLKNRSNLLPLDAEKTKIAVIGPNANRAIAGGGGSASLNPYYNTLPLWSIQRASSKDVTYALGCDIYKWIPLATPFCKALSGEEGVTIEFYTGDKFESEPTVVQTRTSTDLMLWDSAPTEVGNVWSAHVRAKLTPKTTGKHKFSFFSVGPGRLYIDGKLLADLWDWTEQGETMFDGSEDVVVEVELEAGRTYELMSELTNEIRPLSKQITIGRTHGPGGVRIGYKEEDKVDHLQQAVDAATEADVAVVIVGLDSEWESEGYDRANMDLPKDGSQDRLVEAVLKANPNTIVVVQAGSPVTMPWADKVPSILQAWYQGQEAGNALADVLFGRVNPSGKLPTTFPVRLQDNPTYHSWPGENKKVVYGEGIFMGYRHYERLAIKPLFAFGHGLSYTTFSYGDITLSNTTLSANEKLTVTIPITNSGKVDGAEVVQGYVHDVKSRLVRPEKELAVFDKVFLKAGETKDVVLTLDKLAVGYYDTRLKAWIAEEGEFKILVGSSSDDIRQSATFDVAESFTWIF